MNRQILFVLGVIVQILFIVFGLIYFAIPLDIVPPSLIDDAIVLVISFAAAKGVRRGTRLPPKE